ncbi:MAG: APH(3') family aminoglycoside O-phosphotransferase [Novosphingobium sp.]
MNNSQDLSRLAPCAAPVLPSSFLSGSVPVDWRRSLVGESGCTVYQTMDPHHGEIYLKHGEGVFAHDVVAEHERLVWLGAFWPVPEVAGFHHERDQAWLMTRAVSGRTAWEVLGDADADAEAISFSLGRFLQRLHGIPANACPFDASHSIRLELARERIARGEVDEDDFDDARKGWSAAQVWSELQSLLPIRADKVVTHGDFSLDNLLVEDGQITGCIDVGRCGMADRYQDIAIMWNCLGEFGDQCRSAFLRGYGLDSPDDRRLSFFLLLDELF